MFDLDRIRLVIALRKYYLFLVKKEYIDAYQKKPEVLFKTLHNLYEMKENYNSGLSVYHQICNVFDKRLLTHYFFNKKEFQGRRNQFYFIKNQEMSLLKINYSCLILFTNHNFSSFFKVLKIYNPHLFVCDFDYGDYFWLDQYHHISHKIKYN